MKNRIIPPPGSGAKKKGPPPIPKNILNYTASEPTGQNTFQQEQTHPQKIQTIIQNIPPQLSKRQEYAKSETIQQSSGVQDQFVQKQPAKEESPNMEMSFPMPKMKAPLQPMARGQIKKPRIGPPPVSKISVPQPMANSQSTEPQLPSQIPNGEPVDVNEAFPINEGASFIPQKKSEKLQNKQEGESNPSIPNISKTMNPANKIPAPSKQISKNIPAPSRLNQVKFTPKKQPESEVTTKNNEQPQTKRSEILLRQQKVVKNEQIKQSLKVPTNPSSFLNPKSQIFTPLKSIPQKHPTSAIPTAGSASKGRMAEKLQQLRRAKQQMLNEELESEGEEVQFQEDEQLLEQTNVIMEEVPKEEKPQFQLEAKKVVPAIQENPKAPIQTDVQKQVVDDKATKKQKQSSRVNPPRPPLGKTPAKQLPIQTKKITPQLPKQIKPQLPLGIQPKSNTQIIENFEPHFQKPLEAVPQKVHRPEPAIKVQLQTKADNEISSLLERYHGLKNQYLNNIRQLDELMHFQKQQEQAQIQKINHLLSELHKKNQSIRQMCQMQSQPLPDQADEIAV